MLSYQHGYHAGNFADVLKHVGLTLLLEYATQKEKPLFYLETHAGKGLYDLHDAQAVKTGEAHQGVNILWESQKTLPAVFQPYMNQLIALNPDKTLRYYPGSPTLAIRSLQPDDRALFCELHPREFEALRKIERTSKKMKFLHGDGLEQLKSALPPIEKRGIIFIDPSFELKSDYRDVPVFIKKGIERFATGTYCLWYPLVNKKFHQQLLRGLEGLGVEKAIRIEFQQASPGPGMYGCGLWVINPPYVFEQQMQIVLKTLSTLFNPNQSTYLIQWTGKP